MPINSLFQTSMCDVEIKNIFDLILLHDKIKTAESISLSRSSLVNVPLWTLSLDNLRSLDLSSNSFSSLNDIWTANLPHLTELNLSACWLKNLPVGYPTFSKTLETLYLDGNYLGNDYQNFSVFEKLKTLSIVGNDFLEIPVLPKNLEKLIFRLNSFSVIPEHNLKVLDACYCRVRKNLVIKARQLNVLDLSHCNLKGRINFPSLPLLDTLDLSNNSISEISFESSRRITDLRLSFNGISSFPSFLFNLPMIRNLQISHNAINLIPKDLSKLKRLENLDISHNQLITQRLILPQKLQSLVISFNYYVAFEAFPYSLKHLDASFCSTVVIPPIPSTIEWIGVYFVKTLVINEIMKSLNDESDKKELETAIVPSSLFKKERILLTNANGIDVPTLVNDKLSDNIGCSATSGRSTKYEDNFMNIKIGDVTFVGVFDGHVGHESAFICAEAFSKILGNTLVPVFDEEKNSVKKAMKKSFALVNDELSRRSVKDGTTAVVLGVKGKRFVIGHVGDSLALMVCKDRSEWLTNTHRPTEITEYYIMKEKKNFVSSDWRINGKLCVSRSLGDFWCCDSIYNKPDVSVRELPDGIISIVLACDGLWDYVDPGIISNIVRKVSDPVKASKLLQDYAFASGSHDSISVIIMNFPNQ